MATHTTTEAIEASTDHDSSTRLPSVESTSTKSPSLQAIKQAERINDALAQLQSIGMEALLPAEPTDDELLQLPLDKVLLNEALILLPKRGSSKHDLAVEIASVLYPSQADSIGSIIRYEHDRVKICRWIRLARRHEIVTKTRAREQHDWRLHIEQQGLWDPVKQPIALTGPPSLPMPVEIATAESLEPFFAHLRNDGTHEAATLNASLPAQEIAEPYYNTAALEFPRGVVYEDRRLDLCKMVVGPTHIGTLMESLRMSTFINHFLLGNNIIGPKGAREIAAFLHEFPNRIDTWYLAGNAIHGPAFSELVQAMAKSPAVTNIWLKRNPLGTQDNNPVDDLFTLITQTPNLRTLDLDQTELGDARVAELFDKLLDYDKPNKLEIIYLNGNGISTKGATAIGKYMASSQCRISSLYMSNNPIGNDGVHALASGLAQNEQLIRFSFQSVGMGDAGLGALVDALRSHPTLKTFDVGTSYSTEDLGQAYNVFTNNSVPFVGRLIESSQNLEYLNLGAVVMDTESLNLMLAVAADSPSLLFYSAIPTTRVSYRDNDLDYTRLRQLVKDRVTANIQAKHGQDMTYAQWYAEEKRWCTSDKTDVRKIDSVYRTRDLGLARRGLKSLDKWWTEDNESVLKGAMEDAVGPFCTLRKKTGFWADKTNLPS